MQNALRIFKDGAGALLLGAATVLFVSNWAGALPDAVPPREPVFLIPVPDLFWIAGGLAAAAALGCLLFDRLFFQMLGLAWLTSCFLAYRVGLFFSGAHTLGGYLGDVSRAFGIAPAAAGFMADALLVCLLLSSVFAAVWLWQHEEPIPAKTDLKTVCPECGGQIAFAAVRVGQQIACPHCGKAVTLRRHEMLKMTCVLCGGHLEFPVHAVGRK